MSPNPAPSAPAFLYGTAWKEDRTPALVELALRTGFRGIDTANQRRHYFEAGVGQGLAAAYRAGVVTRDDLFLQTKFTYARGQDHRLPYDPSAPLARQVEQSFASSLEHLGTSYVDSYVLHGPEGARGLTAGDVEVANHFTSTHPDSVFRRTLTIQRDRKSTRLNSSHMPVSRMPSSA